MSRFGKRMDADGQRDDSSQAFEALLGECLAAFEAGDEGAMARLCAAHPAYAESLRGALERMRGFGLLRRQEPALPDQLGAYRLESRVGHGGMGVVFRAWDQTHSRPVALKLIRPENLHHPATRARFRREVRSLIQLRHPNIVRALGGGEHEGIPYLAMEWLPGQGLDQLARTAAGRPGWERRAIRLILQACEAIRHAHTHGIIHRDIKPANMLVQAQDRLKLIDFGLAHLGDGESLTRDDAVLGSPRFMAPEQARGGAVTPAADIYALGASLEALATSDGERDLSPALRRICRRATQQHPLRRYPTVGALIDDLQRLLAGRRPRWSRWRPLLRLRSILAAFSA